MADDADRAQAYQDLVIRNGIERARRGLHSTATDCERCGDPIGEARLRAGAVGLCIDCAEKMEELHAG